MSASDRREREREGTREKILEAARELFGREGYEAVTMRAIGDRAEYTPTAIYHHFENKQDLVTCLCQDDFANLAHHFARAAAVVDPVERLRVTGEAYLQFAIDHPHHYRFMFMTPLPPIEHDADYLAERKGNPEQDAYALLHVACLEAIEQGRLRPELTDAHEIAQMLWGLLHGLISLRMTKTHDEWVPFTDLRSIARDAMDAVFRGILKNPAESPFRHAEPTLAGAKAGNK